MLVLSRRSSIISLIAVVVLLISLTIVSAESISSSILVLDRPPIEIAPRPKLVVEHAGYRIYVYFHDSSDMEVLNRTSEGSFENLLAWVRSYPSLIYHLMDKICRDGNYVSKYPDILNSMLRSEFEGRRVNLIPEDVAQFHNDVVVRRLRLYERYAIFLCDSARILFIGTSNISEISRDLLYVAEGLARYNYKLVVYKIDIDISTYYAENLQKTLFKALKEKGYDPDLFHVDLITGRPTILINSTIDLEIRKYSNNTEKDRILYSYAYSLARNVSETLREINYPVREVNLEFAFLKVVPLIATPPNTPRESILTNITIAILLAAAFVLLILLGSILRGSRTTPVYATINYH